MIMIRYLVAVALAALIGPSLAAQEVERIDGEKAGKAAKVLIPPTAKLPDVPFQLKPNVPHSLGFAIKKRAVFVIPDERLSADAIAKAEQQFVPLGVLYFVRIAPVVVESPLPGEKQRLVEVADGNDKTTVSVFYLATSNVAGRPVLLVYGKDKAPVLVTTLVDADEDRKVPVQLDALPGGGDSRATLLVTIGGRFRGAIQLTTQD